MKSRVLPIEEWDRLVETDIPALFPLVDPGDLEVAVVEDNGRVVACLGVIRLTHFEGLWISPEYRGNPGVSRRLMREAGSLAKQWTPCVIGGAEEGSKGEQMREVLERIGAKRIPVEFYALKFERGH